MAGAASVSVAFFYNMLGYTELNVNTTINHLALTSYLANPSFKIAVLLEISLTSRKSDNVSIATVYHESRPHPLVTVMLAHISIISPKSYLNHQISAFSER